MSRPVGQLSERQGHSRRSSWYGRLLSKTHMAGVVCSLTAVLASSVSDTRTLARKTAGGAPSRSLRAAHGNGRQIRRVSSLLSDRTHSSGRQPTSASPSSASFLFACPTPLPAHLNHHNQHATSTLSPSCAHQHARMPSLSDTLPTFRPPLSKSRALPSSRACAPSRPRPTRALAGPLDGNQSSRAREGPRAAGPCAACAASAHGASCQRSARRFAESNIQWAPSIRHKALWRLSQTFAGKSDLPANAKRCPNHLATKTQTSHMPSA